MLVDAYPAKDAQLPAAPGSPRRRVRTGRSRCPPFALGRDAGRLPGHARRAETAACDRARLPVATITDPQGRPAQFTPWFGALAHAIFFRAGSLDYFHTHVCGPSTPGCTSILGGAKVVGRPTAPGRIRVGVLLPIAGTWRLFLQFQTDGRIITAPFTLRVR